MVSDGGVKTVKTIKTAAHVTGSSFFMLQQNFYIAAVFYGKADFLYRCGSSYHSSCFTSERTFTSTFHSTVDFHIRAAVYGDVLSGFSHQCIQFRTRKRFRTRFSRFSRVTHQDSWSRIRLSSSMSSGLVAQLVAKRTIVCVSSYLSQKPKPTCSASAAI